MPRDHAKWVVALTDGADTESKGSEDKEAAKLFEQTKNLNFAMISIGEGADEAKVQPMVDAARKFNEAISINAKSPAEVKQAFERSSWSASAGEGAGDNTCLLLLRQQYTDMDRTWTGRGCGRVYSLLQQPCTQHGTQQLCALEGVCSCSNLQ